MSLPILVNTDFTNGADRISQNADTTTQLNDYISTFENRYIKSLLNDLMFTEIRDNVTLHSKYTALINGVDWLDDDGDLHVLEGFKKALKGFIYYHFVGDNFMSTPVGNVRNSPEISTQVTTGQNTQICNNRFNAGIDYYLQCLDFVLNYDKIYEDINSSVESPAGTFTIAVDSTLYLETGDTVTISGVDYVIANLIADTSFEITATAGTVFSGSFFYQPFKDANLYNISKEWL